MRISHRTSPHSTSGDSGEARCRRFVPFFAPIDLRFLKLAFFAGAILLAGCSSLPPRVSTGYIDELVRHADQNHGRMLASGGPLISVTSVNNGAVLRIATPNYAQLFDVSFPSYPSNLTIGRDVDFFGTLAGSQQSREAYAGRIILIDGRALKPVGKPALIAVAGDAAAEAWLKGALDLSTAAPTGVTSTSAFSSDPDRRESTDVRMLPASTEPAPTRASNSEIAAEVQANSSPAVQQMLEAWSRLSASERNEFLRRAGISR